MSRDTILSGGLPIALGTIALALLVASELRSVLGRPPAHRLAVVTAVVVAATFAVIATRFALYA